MTADLFLGVDVGTYETKGVLVAPDGRVEATAAIGHAVIFPKAGWAEHDPEKTWWGEVCDVTRTLLRSVSADRVKGVGISAIGADVLPVDERMNPLRNGILYGVDTRAVDEIAEMNYRFGEDAIFEASGNVLSSQATGPKVLWIMKNEPDVYAKARWFVSATTFIVARLTGRVVIDHFSAGLHHPTYDPRTQGWNEDFLDGILQVHRMPEIQWSHEVAGTVTDWAAEQTGLVAGTPVSTGTIDAGAEALSVGVIEPGEMMLMYGSTVFMIQVTENKAARDRRLWAGPYLFPETWCLLAGMATSGSLTRWFRDHLAADLLAAEAAGGQEAYAALATEAAASPPGSNGVIVLPYFSGERTPINDPQAKGTIFGLSLTHTRGDLFRAVLEGIGHGIKQHVELFTEMGALPSVIRAVGGGTKNPTWLQSVSDITGVRQEVPPVTVGACYGDAVLAGIAVGELSPEVIRDWQAGGATVVPDPETAATYRPLHQIYSSLYGATKEQMHRLHRLGY
ncbi:MAG: FGGY-family carbohydrate kinase [Mycolicibacterium sp.]|uniref:FGGY-family carbohydrate kinase n=1 Tax=Mycolicibacterium sp. TaxID=2320850 RepID=UPI003D147838